MINVAFIVFVCANKLFLQILPSLHKLWSIAQLSLTETPPLANSIVSTLLGGIAKHPHLFQVLFSSSSRLPHAS